MTQFTNTDIYTVLYIYQAQWCVPARNWSYMPLKTNPNKKSELMLMGRATASV